LDELFEQLAKAGSDEEAKPIEDHILNLFLESGSASVDLLMTRAATALASDDKDTAQRLLAAVTKVAPDYAEGWHQRGKLQALAGDDEGAIISLQKAVSLNPRQFAAMTELGGILVDYGDKRDALKLLRKAEALDRHFSGVDHEVQQLSREVEGERI
jgi:Flp pilus assembly protein TadD